MKKHWCGAFGLVRTMCHSLCWSAGKAQCMVSISPRRPHTSQVDGRSRSFLQVQGGKIVAANWNGISTSAVLDKKSESAAGRYGMIKASKLGKEWHEQAAVVEKYLVSTQDTAFSKYSSP